MEHTRVVGTPAVTYDCGHLQFDRIRTLAVKVPVKQATQGSVLFMELFTNRAISSEGSVVSLYT